MTEGQDPHGEEGGPSRAVMTVAGRGTRMLPATRGMRKELLPLFYRGRTGTPMLAPVAHLVVRSLWGAGVRDITLVVGSDASLLQRYLTPDPAPAEPPASGRGDEELAALNGLLRSVNFRWAIQPSPQGFGDAVLRARSQIGESPFALHAADAMLWEPEPGRVLRRMEAVRSQEEADVVLLVRRVRDPRRYGVVEGTSAGRFGPMRVLKVRGMEEKPQHPKSPWAATAMYAFSPAIFRALEKEAEGHPPELEVTAGISRLLTEGAEVRALILRPEDGLWLSVGSPEGYFRALHRTYRKAKEGALTRPEEPPAVRQT